MGLYDLNAAVEFDAAYLSGYLTDKYDENEKNIVERANKYMKDSIHQMFSQTAQGYASVVLKSVDIRTLDSKTSIFSCLYGF